MWDGISKSSHPMIMRFASSFFFTYEEKTTALLPGIQSQLTPLKVSRNCCDNQTWSTLHYTKGNAYSLGCTLSSYYYLILCANIFLVVITAIFALFSALNARTRNVCLLTYITFTNDQSCLLLNWSQTTPLDSWPCLLASLKADMFTIFSPYHWLSVLPKCSAGMIALVIVSLACVAYSYITTLPTPIRICQTWPMPSSSYSNHLHLIYPSMCWVSYIFNTIFLFYSNINNNNNCWQRWWKKDWIWLIFLTKNGWSHSIRYLIRCTSSILVRTL